MCAMEIPCIFNHPFGMGAVILLDGRDNKLSFQYCLNPFLSLNPLQPIQLPTPSNTYLSNYPPPALWDNMDTNVFL